MTKETFIKELDKILKRATINEELDKIIDKIDDKEKWLIDIKTERLEKHLKEGKNDN